jgi:hypothetical protein
VDWNGQIFLCVKVISSRQSSQDNEKFSCPFQSTENFPEWKLVLIDLTDYFLLPNGLVFVSNTYSCFVLSRVENDFVIEPKNSKKQIRPGKHGNIIFICP